VQGAAGHAALHASTQITQIRMLPVVSDPEPSSLQIGGSARGY
jgi:hypothetical protein